MIKKTERFAGFTLMELAIVLVIIGLIIGGILSGQTLIRSAQTKRIITQFEAFDRAVVAFKGKYGGLPGDITNATEYFSGVTNGNGDGKILWTDGDTVSAWQELGLSGLVEGNFTGTGSTLTASNAPVNSTGAGVFGIYYKTDVGTSSYIFLNGPKYGVNYLELMASGSTPDSTPRGTLLPIDAIAIDTKLDDGKPTTGRIIGGFGSYLLCSSADSNYSGVISYNYNISYNNNLGLCTVSMRLSVQ